MKKNNLYVYAFIPKEDASANGLLISKKLRETLITGVSETHVKEIFCFLYSSETKKRVWENDLNQFFDMRQTLRILKTKHGFKVSRI